MPQKELRDFFFDVLERGDVSGFENCIHEDFIYIRETEMFTRDEFRDDVLGEFIDGTMISSDLRVIFDNEKVIILDLNITRGDVYGKVTLCCLKKDGKIWRQMMTFDEMAKP